MGKRDYERLEIVPFGRHLIETQDLDPVYGMVRDLPGPQLSRWLIAYWCYYHCGAASYLSEHTGSGFWNQMMRAAKNELPAPTGGRWPRGHERRHARGQQAVKMVTHLRQRYGNRPEEMVDGLKRACSGGADYTVVADVVRSHALFGPWISFKVADMLDRVLDVPVNFDEAHVFMFKDPKKAALMLWRQEAGYSEDARVRDEHGAVHEVVEHLKREFADLAAPPRRDRRVDLQEVETVLCKWKSHMNGHYPLWNDTDDIGEGLLEWGKHSSTAKNLADWIGNLGGER